MISLPYKLWLLCIIYAAVLELPVTENWCVEYICAGCCVVFFKLLKTTLLLFHDMKDHIEKRLLWRLNAQRLLLKNVASSWSCVKVSWRLSALKAEDAYVEVKKFGVICWITQTLIFWPNICAWSAVANIAHMYDMAAHWHCCKAWGRWQRLRPAPLLFPLFSYCFSCRIICSRLQTHIVICKGAGI